MRCEPAHHFTIAKSLSWRSAIDDRPAYQRTSAVWSLDRRQLFIDSLLNGYDVPKIYLHDLRGQHPTKVYAVVDGKQRLTAIWSFLRDGFPLAEGFRIEAEATPGVPSQAVAPAGALRFSKLDPAWQSSLLQTYLSVVLIRDASEEDIEELFSRLNNGVPLDPAERRNAIGGDMAGLIREVAAQPAFAEPLGFTNERLLHFDLAARLLVREMASDGAPGEPSLRSDALDRFVREHRRLTPADRGDLMASIGRRLALSGRVFDADDPLLASPEVADACMAFAWDHLGGDPAPAALARLRALLDGARRERRPDGLSPMGDAARLTTLLSALVEPADEAPPTDPTDRG